MIQCCCELPFTMLDKEMEVNDYDFVLYHHYLHSDIYKNNYLKRRKEHPERMMILDNSAYEFFVSHERFYPEDYAAVINELKPDYYIVPDTLMNAEETVYSAVSWVHTYYNDCKESGAQPFFTPQGKTKEEFDWCIEVMTRFIEQKNLSKLLCIPFHDQFLREYKIDDDVVRSVYGNQNINLKEEVDKRYALGRVMLMKELAKKYPDYRFHLLGSHDPRELRAHKDIKQIQSFDSGYPVKLGVMGVKFGDEKEKPNIIIDDFCNKSLDEDIKNLIVNNIITMKKF